MNSIGERLKKARGNRSTLEVAKEVGISRGCLQNYEANIRVPRDDVKLRLSNYFGISIQELFY